MTERDRDKSVEQWLRQTPVPGARAEDCLDAETLAVWAEGRLEGPQRAAAEAHAANCARCQAMLAVMVRTTPAAAASAGMPLRKWLMMLGPPMAAAAAVALWFAVAQDHRTPAIESLSKQAKAEVESATSPALPPLAPPALEDDRKMPPTSSDVDLQRRERAAPLADARKERETPEPAAKSAVLPPVTTGTAVAPATAGNEKKDLAAAKREDAVTGADRLGATAPAPVASPSPPPPPAAPRPAESAQAAAEYRPAPPPQQQANQAQNQGQNQAQNQAPSQNQVQTQAQSSPAQRQQQALEERVVVVDKPAASTADVVASRDAGRGGVAGGVAGFLGPGTRANAGDFELVPPGSTIRWRVVEGRSVQRSLDAGATWANQYTADSSVFLTAGTAPSSSVAWLVGRAGAIIVSRDGVSWERVTLPEVADLTSVVAPDARRATVTTVGGRRFATADGGRTWTRQ